MGTFECIDRNCEILAKYAMICQKNNLVPIVEPEIFIEGEFTVEEHQRVFKYILSLLLNKLNGKNVDIKSVIFKIGFVANGLKKTSTSSDIVVENTNEVLESVLPLKAPGVVFLSGGHSQENSLKFLKGICEKQRTLNVTFSYGRALTNNALKEWAGNDSNIEKAQKK